MKKILIICLVVLSGCNADFSGKKTDSLSEKLSMMDREMRQQNGKIEVLEHENKKLLQEMEVLKFDVNARLSTLESIDLSNPPMQEKGNEENSDNNPTDLNSK